MTNAGLYFRLDGFVDSEFGYPCLSTPLYVEASVPQGAYVDLSKRYVADVDDRGVILDFHKVGALSHQPPLRKHASSYPSIHRIGQPAVNALALSESEILIHAATFEDFCDRVSREALDALLQTNPLLGLGLAEVARNEDRQFQFALHSILRLKTFSPALMSKWKAHRTFSHGVADRIAAVWDALLADDTYLGQETSASELPTSQRIAVFANVERAFDFGLYQIGERAFRFEEVPVQGVDDASLEAFGYIIAPTYNFLAGDYFFWDGKTPSKDRYFIAAMNGVPTWPTERYLDYFAQHGVDAVVSNRPEMQLDEISKFIHVTSS